MMVCIHGNRSEENMVGISETPGKKRTERTIKRREAAGGLHAGKLKKWSCPISTISWMKRSWNSF